MGRLKGYYRDWRGALSPAGVALQPIAYIVEEDGDYAGYRRGRNSTWADTRGSNGLDKRPRTMEIINSHPFIAKWLTSLGTDEDDDDDDEAGPSHR